MRKYLPILEWGRTYNTTTLVNDLVAAAIVTIMLVPQSLAYAMLAGLPLEVGLYASMAPLVVYAVFGSSRTLAVGPVAVVSLMTAAALAKVTAPGSADYLAAATTLAALSGAILLVMGVLRLGFLANFLSHPVIAGVVTASGLLIAASQLKHILGIKAHGETLPELLASLFQGISAINQMTFAIGVASIAFLLWVRKGLKPLLIKLGLAPRPADLFAKAGPILALAATSLLAWSMNLGASGVKRVGLVPPC